ncbi:hypothetical protein GBAR_LOCUS17832, partial [Geodia barretti]
MKILCLFACLFALCYQTYETLAVPPLAVGQRPLLVLFHPATPEGAASPSVCWSNRTCSTVYS